MRKKRDGRTRIHTTNQTRIMLPIPNGKEKVVKITIQMVTNLSVDKSNVECFRCQRYSHYKFECKTNLNKNRGVKSNFAEKEKEISLLMACHVKKERHKHLWYLNTDSNNHMCGDK